MLNRMLRLGGLLSFVAATCLSCGDVTVNEAAEVEGDEPGECDDGVDNDQDGAVDCLDEGCEIATVCLGDDDDAIDDDDVVDDDDSAPIDNDGDGSPADEDCDDDDPLNFPGNPEDCDGQDNDCDGLLGEEEVDDDLDLQSECDGDCDDADDQNWLGNTELCDGRDNDCDGFLTPAEIDGDGDGVAECDGDCDDADDQNWPGNTEVCDGQDNDCDALIGSLETDDDSDGITECDGDCDDADDQNWPGNVEICDGQDNDCDALTAAAGGEGDGDGDGVLTCADCDDTASLVFPFAGDSYGDGVDSDCDGLDCEAAAHGLSYFAACPASVLRATALADCTAAGHDGLATLLNAGEQAFVEALRPTPGSVGYWIGYSDMVVDNVFAWDSGLVSAAGYEHWYVTEPNGSVGTDEDCVTFMSQSLGAGAGNGFWGDVFCASATHAYLCETRACGLVEDCSDGLDNDCDGDIDTADDGCP